MKLLHVAFMFSRGAVLIMGAIMLNTLVCALLYHPVEEHMKEVPIDNGTDNEALSLDETQTEVKLRIKLSSKSDLNNPSTIQETTTANCEPTSDHLSDLSKALEKTLNASSIEANQKIDKREVPEKSETILESITEGKNSVTINCEDSSTIPAPGNAKETSTSITISPPLSRTNSSRRSERNEKNYHVSRQGSIVSDMGPIALSPRVPGLFRRIFRTPPKQNNLEKDQGSMESVAEESSKPNKLKKLDEDSSQSSSTSTKFFDFSVLRDPIYLVILISNSTSAISNTNFMILLPSYANDERFDKDSSALLLSIVSIFDVVGRIGGASLSDIDFIPKYYYFVGGLGLSGIALALLPMATNYTALSFFCALFGLSSGMYIGITTVILADMLGTEKLSSSYGISLFVNGVLQLIGPPICGAISEQVGSLKPIFLALGIILILGTALWAAVPIIKRNKKDVEPA